MLHQVRSALIWLWDKQTSYFRRHFIILHLVPWCTIDIVSYSWVRDIAVHLETDLDNLCIGNLWYLLQQTRDTLNTSYFILFKRPPPQQPSSFDLSAWLLFGPVLWDKNGPWATSLFQFLGFFVLCKYFVQYFGEASSIVKYCTVIPHWSQKHTFTNNPSIWWCQTVSQEQKAKTKRGKVLAPNYSKVEPFSWVDDPSASVSV